MRGLLVVLLVGCTLSSRAPGDPDDPFLPPDVPHDGCRSDTGCSRGNICTRSGDCLPPAQVRAVHVTWLVSGKTPDEATCAPHPNLRIDIYPKGDEGDRVSYTPVPCIAGRFTVDKLPTTFDRVWLGSRGGDDSATGTIDTSGELGLDLPF
jgi:hypothetical protein